MSSFILCLSLVLFNSLAYAETNQIIVLSNGPIALQARLEAIESATESIDMVYYIFNPCSDHVGRILMNALIKKADSGVKIRLMIDGYELERDFKTDYQNLPALIRKHKNISLKNYNRSSLWSWTPFVSSFIDNARSHVKLFVVDGKTNNKQAIVGSRNISDEHFGFRKEFNYTDIDFFIKGNSVEQIQYEFNQMWSSNMLTETTTSSALDKTWAKKCLEISAVDQNILTTLDNEYREALQKKTSHNCTNVQFYVDDTHFLDQQTTIGAYENGSAFTGDAISEMKAKKKMASVAVLEFIYDTKKSLAAHNLYYQALSGLEEAFAWMRDHHLKVKVISNITSESGKFGKAVDNVTKNTAENDTEGSQVVLLMSQKGKFNQNSSLTPPQSRWSIHQKTMIRDGKDILIGSYNIDIRSYAQNLETVTVVKNCPTLEKEMELFDDWMTNIYLDDAKNCAECIKEQNKKAHTGLIEMIGANFF